MSRHSHTTGLEHPLEDVESSSSTPQPLAQRQPSSLLQQAADLAQQARDAAGTLEGSLRGGLRQRRGSGSLHGSREPSQHSGTSYQRFAAETGTEGSSAGLPDGSPQQALASSRREGSHHGGKAHRSPTLEHLEERELYNPLGEEVRPQEVAAHAGEGALQPGHATPGQLQGAASRPDGAIVVEIDQDGGKQKDAVEQRDGKQPARRCSLRGFVRLVGVYFGKMKGGVDDALPIPPFIDLFLSWGGAFLGILLVAGLNSVLVQSELHFQLLVASLGASAVLVFGVIESKLAQPRNFIGGQVLSAVIGCAIRLALGSVIWVSAALGMSLSLLAMQLTRTTHPPGGATALIAATMPQLQPAHGFQFVLTVLLGSLGMLLVALITNNLHPTKRYPSHWIGRFP